MRSHIQAWSGWWRRCSNRPCSRWRSRNAPTCCQNSGSPVPLSALKAQGFDVFWPAVEEFHRKRHASGEFDARRKQQALAWMWDIVHARLHADFHHHAAVRNALPQAVRDVTEALVAPSSAARALLNLFEPATR